LKGSVLSKSLLSRPSENCPYQNCQYLTCSFCHSIIRVFQRILAYTRFFLHDTQRVHKSRSRTKRVDFNRRVGTRGTQSRREKKGRHDTRLAMSSRGGGGFSSRGSSTGTGTKPGQSASYRCCVGTGLREVAGRRKSISTKARLGPTRNFEARNTDRRRQCTDTVSWGNWGLLLPRLTHPRKGDCNS